MTSSTRSQFTAASTLILAVAPAYADSTGFQGFYAPDTWTVTGAGLGGSSAIFAANGSELTITGPDGGYYANTDVSHVIAADGVWSFQWSFYVLDPNFGLDTAYYLINGDSTFLSYGEYAPSTGTLSVAVQAGDVIGWRIESLDGALGPGVLTITDFRAPVPSPAALALLSLAALPRARRRR